MWLAVGAESDGEPVAQAEKSAEQIREQEEQPAAQPQGDKQEAWTLKSTETRKAKRKGRKLKRKGGLTWRDSAKNRFRYSDRTLHIRSDDIGSLTCLYCHWLDFVRVFS